jgi:hypothetical protein
VKILLFVVCGLYVCSFGGAWLRAHADVVRSAAADRIGTYQRLQQLEAQQQRDYLAWLQGRASEEVVRADDARVRAYREKVLAQMRSL